MVDSIYIILRGQEVTIDDIVWGAAEPNVGIPHRYMKQWALKDANGKELDWVLTDEEVDFVSKEIREIDGGDDSDDDRDYYLDDDCSCGDEDDGEGLL